MRHRAPATLRLLSGLLVLLACAAPVRAEVPEPPESFAREAEERFEATRQAYRQQPDNPTVAWKFARACFLWADYAQTKEARAERGQLGIDVCRKLIEQHPKLAPAHYYLGMNLGQLARTKTLGALSIVRDMEQAFRKAIELNPRIDHAGPHRNLGLLYRDAPGWPVSVGSRPQARHHLLQARKLFPDYPGNLITYLESLLEWKELASVRQQIPEVHQRLNRARQRLTGPEWKSDWAEWQQRWQNVQTEAGLEPVPIGEPRSGDGAAR